MHHAKKIITGLVIGAALITAALFLAQKEATETVSGALTAEGVAKVNALLTRDADRDNLMDWEEELWQTDATASDTDGDGTADGEEIRLGRNPLVPGPNDPLDEETIRAKVNEPNPEEETRTAEFSRTFFNNYLNARREFGGKLPPNTLENLVKESLALLPEDAAAAFTEKDLTLSADEGEALRAYGNAIAEAIAANSPTGLEDAGEIISRAIATEAEEELAALAPHLAAYQGLISALRATPVPKEAAAAHLEFLNAVAGAREGLAGMQALYTNPLNVIPALTLFQASVEKLKGSFRALQALFIRENVRFTPEESGYLLERIEV